MKQPVKIEKMRPVGFCPGVEIALKKLKEMIGQNNPPFYIYGEIVHNAAVNENLAQLGLIVLDRLDILPELEKGIIFFSAHSSKKQDLDYAQKYMKVVDLACLKVLDVKSKIAQKIAEGYNVLYLGKPGHQEAESAISIDYDKIELITSVESITLDPDKKYYLTSQTTISSFLFEEVADFVKTQKTEVVIECGICAPSRIRQTSIMRQDYQMIIVVSDKNSSNGMELYHNALKVNQNVLLISTSKDLKQTDFEGISSVLVASSASSSEEEVDLVIAKIESFYK